MRKNKYKVAKYMRLSRDDGDDRESESIENQRDIIDNYINEFEDLEIIEEYVDDGFTGTNFNRPGFQKMMDDARKKKFNILLVKDISRLGRTMHHVGKLIDEITKYDEW